jgi:hypothetical protein
MANPVPSHPTRRKTNLSPALWGILTGQISREHERLALLNPASPRLRPTLPPVSLLADSPEPPTPDEAAAS